MHRNTTLIFEKYIQPRFQSNQKVIEIGPILPSIFYEAIGDKSITWHSADICENSDLTYSGIEPYSIPAEDESYDVVFAANVIEHVGKIWLWIREMERICKPGGQLLLINPISWPHHLDPTDCWRIYPDGMKALLEDTKFELVDCRIEAMEKPQYRRQIHGKSWGWCPFWVLVIYKLLGPFGFPVQTAQDLVTIAVKKSD
jgi:SAM-dependent methyltransferase